MLAPAGIRVNALAPGPVWTPIDPASRPPGETPDHVPGIPLGRAAQPRELAPVYALLASDDASFITGAVYSVAGGMVLP
jgi:NAD(P)-dependent dehydrogenase (short-subunit alcohol dehydrogenase family)